jgi:hypothetical protein
VKKKILFMLLAKVLGSRGNRSLRRNKFLFGLFGLATVGAMLAGVLFLWAAASLAGKAFDFTQARVVSAVPAVDIPAKLSSWGERPLVSSRCLDFAVSLVQTSRLLTRPIKDTWEEASGICFPKEGGISPLSRAKEDA